MRALLRLAVELVRVVGVSAILVVFGTRVVAQAQDNNEEVVASFSDDDGSIHEVALDALAAEGWLAGTECEEGQICPKLALQRWELAVWLGRALTGGSEPPAVSASRFADVDSKQWWAPHAERIAELDVTTGCQTQTEPLAYCPYNALTRAQLATILVRAFSLPAIGSIGFADIADNIHADNINALAAAGITAGCVTEPLSYCPQRPVTKGQMATFIARAIGLVPKSEVPLPVEGTYRTVSAGWAHTCAIRSDNAIECWGTNDNNQVASPAGTFKAVAAGWKHSCGLRSYGTVECWGNNDYKQSAPSHPKGVYKAITAGGTHSCAVRSNDTINCWGNNQGYGQANAPTGTFKAVAAGWAHSCAIRGDDTIACWGNNDSNQTKPPTGTYKAITAGSAHNCAIHTNDTVQCWGHEDGGRTDPPRGTFKAVAAGWAHSCGIRGDDTIACWGNNDSNQTKPPAGTYKAITAGWAHNCAIHTNGTIQCWGNSDNGRIEPPT